MLRFHSPFFSSVARYFLILSGLFSLLALLTFILFRKPFFFCRLQRPFALFVCDIALLVRVIPRLSFLAC